MKGVYFLLLLGLIVACNPQKQLSKEKVLTSASQQESLNALQEVFNMMQGSFDSSAQANRDTTYYNISLRMYPIWENQGYYLYVEQALASMQEKPYRQRVYHLTAQEDGSISSAVFKLPADSLYIGKWKTPESFNLISPSLLEEREGCAVILKSVGANKFQGSTGEKTCKSTLRGASYASSKVTLSPNKIESWDQGFDSSGKQVWGATEGGYVFEKIRE